MKKTLLLLLIAPTFLFSQSTIWEKNFDSYSDFTGIRGSNSYTESSGYTPASETKWVLDASGLELTSATNDHLYINVSAGDGELHARDLDGSAYFTTENIDISSQTGNVTLKFGKLHFDAFTSGDFNGSEYVDVFYSTDDGATYTLIPHQAGSESGAGHTFADDGAVGIDFETSLDYSFDPGAATTVKLRVKMFNNGGNERFEIDDISVERNTAVIWSENFDSYADNYGYVGIAGLPAAQNNSGDYPGSLTKWTISPSAGFVNQNDYAAVRNGMFIFNDVDNPVTFETEDIDITGVANLTYSLNVNFGTSFDGTEYMDIYYSTDGGATFNLEGGTTHTYEALVNITESSTVNFSNTLSGLSATDFRIRVVAFSESNVEDFEIDNIAVVNEATAGVNDVFSASVKIYPNPLSNSKILTIETPFNNSKRIQLFDVLGKEVHSSYTANKSINLSYINSGIYILRLEQDKKFAIKKLIIN